MTEALLCFSLFKELVLDPFSVPATEAVPPQCWEDYLIMRTDRWNRRRKLLLSGGF